MKRRMTCSLRRLRVEASPRRTRRMKRGSLAFTAFSIVRTCSLRSRVRGQQNHGEGGEGGKNEPSSVSVSASLDVAAGRDPFDGSATSFISMSCVSTMIFLVEMEFVVEKNLDENSEVLKMISRTGEKNASEKKKKRAHRRESFLLHRVGEKEQINKLERLARR